MRILGAKLRPPPVRAISRARLGAALDRLWEHKLGLVVAPAGSGKTTLLTQYAAQVDSPVIWYRADVRDGSSSALLASLAQGAAASLGDLPRAWESSDDAVRAFEDWAGARCLIVVDDLHYLEGTPAEQCLARLVEDTPPSVALLMATRRPPAFNLSRLRVSGALLEIGPDDLRFRSWEVEELFRELYREPLAPDDLAALARRTEGWAAGLQLFHLATEGKPARERQRVLRSLGVGPRLVREYLARNVLDELPPALTNFLIETCILGRLTGPLCDRLLDRTGSASVLAELERRQVFTTSLDGEAVYRYHEVLQSHLETLLVERYSEAPARALYARAAQLLVDEGMLPEALRAFGRAGDWDGAAELLQSRGEQLIDGPAGWVDSLPARVVEHDPWLQLALARRSFAAGRWPAAVAEYRRAEASFASAAGADVCRRERSALAAWLEPSSAPPADWTGAVRLAVARDPTSARARAVATAGPGGSLAEGLCALVAGRVREASGVLAAVAEAPETSPLPALGARIAWTVATALAGNELDPEQCERLARSGERLGSALLAFVARSLLAWQGHDDGDEAGRLAAYSRANDNPWGVALAGCIGGLGALRSGAGGLDDLDAAAGEFHRLGAGGLEAWCRAGAAVVRARAGDPEAGHAALQAETLARAAGIRGAQALSFWALAQSADEGAEEYRALALAIAEECGLAFGALTPPPAVVSPPVTTDARVLGDDNGPATTPHGAPAPVVELRCLGAFSVRVDGRLVDPATVKPRARAALRLLAIHAPRPVHRELLMEALWPRVDPKVGTRNLHVVISSLRKLLDPGAARGASSLIVRERETYRFDLPGGAVSDLISFDAALAAGRDALARGDPRRAAAAFRTVLDLYRGDLLADEGSPEWTAPPRDRYRSEATRAAQSLAEIELAQGNPVAAAAAADRGLRLDRYCDPLWRLRIRASAVAGDMAESARVERSYQEVLAELGIDVSASC